MNLAKEITNIKRKKAVKEGLLRAFRVIRNYLCTHRDLEEEIILMDLGNSKSSLLEEIFGEEVAKKSNQMYIRRVICANCGREISREVLREVYDQEEN